MTHRVLGACVGVLFTADLIATAGIAASNHAAATAAAAAAPTNPTSTTLAPVGVFPLTGREAFDAALLNRPALSVKIDNAPDAHPQAGLDRADLVTEELVEGGLTRFMATFQSQDAPVVGPVRSVRPVDADLLHELGGGVFAYSGGSTAALAPVRARSGAVLLTEEPGSAFVRDRGRAAPANLFASTRGLYDTAAQVAPNLSAPPALFSYATAPPPGSPGVAVTLRFSANSVDGWVWDVGRGSYVRRDGGAPSMLTDGSPVTTSNVVVLAVATTASGIYDVRGNQTPTSVVVGTGACWVLRNGIVEVGTWQRPSADAPVRLVAGDGSTIALSPGRTWLELLPSPNQPEIR